VSRQSVSHPRFEPSVFWMRIRHPPTRVSSVQFSAPVRTKSSSGTNFFPLGYFSWNSAVVSVEMAFISFPIFSSLKSLPSEPLPSLLLVHSEQARSYLWTIETNSPPFDSGSRHPEIFRRFTVRPGQCCPFIGIINRKTLFLLSRLRICCA
jgi:hypothetical protein